MKRIIYMGDNGVLQIILPVPGCWLTIEQIAAKDVPFGKPYKIVDVTDIPARDYRNALYADEQDLTDGVGADYGAGSSNIIVGWDGATPITTKEGQL